MKFNPINFFTVLLLSVFAIVNPSLARTFNGTVSQVIDGDTIKVKTSLEEISLDLACIDAPELSQSTYGISSKERLSQILPNNSVVRIVSIDSSDAGTSDLNAYVYHEQNFVNLQMVKEGHAIVSEKEVSKCFGQENHLNAAQTVARENRREFWSQASPTMPWDIQHVHIPTKTLTDKDKWSNFYDLPIEIQASYPQLKNLVDNQNWDEALNITNKLIKAYPDYSTSLSVYKNIVLTAKENNKTSDYTQRIRDGYVASPPSSNCQYSWQTDSIGRRCGERAASRRPNKSRTLRKSSYSGSSGASSRSRYKGGGSSGRTYVRGYTRKDGTRVRGHYRRK